MGPEPERGESGPDQGPRAWLIQQHRSTVAHRDSLRRALQDLIEGSAVSNTDDEHDPEGTTIAFERAQLQSMLASTEQHLADAELALSKLEDGRFGRCEVCGGAIEQPRLEARPTARTCLACASRHSNLGH